MKKIWLVMLLVSSVCVFTACSDDDDEKGGNNGNNPITEFYLSDEIETGESTTVLGKGFTSDAKIFVENAAGDRREVENLVANTKGITFTLPSDLPTGEYSLILKQNGGEWKLDSFKAIQMKEVTQVKKITYSMWPEGNEEGKFEAPNDLTYDEYGKLKSFSQTGEIQGEDGGMVPFTMSYDFTYTADGIEVGGSAINNEDSFPITYVLKDGKVVSSKTKNYESNFETGEGTIVDAEYTWNYDGDYLKSLTGSTTINYKFEDGNLMSIDYNEFAYGKEVNNSGVDIVSCILFFNNEMTPDLFFASLTGVGGKMSTNLPTNVLGDCTYTMSGDKVDIVTIETAMMGMVFMQAVSFEYQTVKVKVE